MKCTYGGATNTGVNRCSSVERDGLVLQNVFGGVVQNVNGLLNG